MRKPMTQCECILRHLEECGSITPIEAITQYGVLRLASRIRDLRLKGHRISSKTASHTNRFGQKVYYSVYELIKEA